MYIIELLLLDVPYYLVDEIEWTLEEGAIPCIVHRYTRTSAGDQSASVFALPDSDGQAEAAVYYLSDIKNHWQKDDRAKVYLSSDKISFQDFESGGRHDLH